MGGKTWSKEEEDVFWLQLIPHSPKRLGKDIKRNEEKSWVWVGQQMTEIMGDRGRRKYTELCVFEHYFQNTCLARFSPNARRLPLQYYKHEKKLKKNKDDAREAETKRQKAHEAAADALAVQVAQGSAKSPIEINCQYPTIPSFHGHAPIPRFTVPSAPPSFGPPGYLPSPPQYYLPHQYLANHHRFENTEIEEDSLFVTQPSASWMDAAPPHPPRGYGYHH